MGCGASKAGPCVPVQVPCTGKSPVRLNSTPTKNNKTTKLLPRTTKAAELRRQANEAKLKNSNGLNSSTSLRRSTSIIQASKKITSSARSPRPKDNRPNNAATTSKPQNCHLGPNVPQSSSKPQGNISKSTNEARPASSQSVKSLKSSGISKPLKENTVNTTSEAKTTTKARPASSQSVNSLKSSGISKSSKENTVNTTSEAKTTTEVRPASSQSVKSLKSSGISKSSKENTVNTTSKTKTITEVRPASSQSVKSLKSSGISKSSEDNAVNTANEARQQIYQSTKRPHSSPSLKKGSSDTKDGAKPMTREPSKRPTSGPTKGHKQQQTKSCQPELPCSNSSVEENLPVIRSKVKSTQRCPQGTVRPKSSQSNDKNTSKTNQTRFQPKSRPRSSPAFKGNPTEATNEVIKRPISNHLSKDNILKTTSNVKRKSCPSLKSPMLRPASAEGNPARTVETRVTGQEAAQEAKADPTDQVLEDGDTPKREDVGDDFQSTSQESAAPEAELDYFVAEILQSQLNLVRNEPSPEKSPKTLNSQPSTMSSPTAGPAPKQGASFVGTPKDATVEDDSSGSQEGTNSSTEVYNVGEVEITAGDSKIIQSPSTPTGIEDNEKAEETGSTSLTTGDVLTMFPKETPHIDSVELMGVPKPVQDGPSRTDSTTPMNFDSVDERKSPGCRRSSPGATKSQEKINLAVQRKSSKTSIEGRKSSRTPTASRSSAKISNLSAGDPVDGACPSQTTCSNSRPCSSRSTTDTSMSLNHRKLGQRPLSAAKVPEKSKSSQNNPHSSARSFSDPRVSDATKSLTPSRKSSHGQVPVKSAERSLSSSRAQSAVKKERLTPTSIRGEFKDEKDCKTGGSQEMSGRGSSATLSKRSVSRNSSKSEIISPKPSVVKKELEKSKSNDKIHQTPNEQKGVVEAKSSCYEREENVKSNDKGTIDRRHSQNNPSTSSLPVKEDLEKRPKSGRSISMESNASIVKSEERLSNPRNSLSQNSLKGRVLSPPQKRHERSGSAGSLKQSPRKFEVLESSKTLQFSSPSYPEVRSRNSRSKTSLNKMEVLNTDYVQNC